MRSAMKSNNIQNKIITRDMFKKLKIILRIFSPGGSAIRTEYGIGAKDKTQFRAPWNEYCKKLTKGNTASSNHLPLEYLEQRNLKPY